MPVFLSALDLAQIPTPATPPAGRNLVYVKADGKVYTKSPAGVETLVGPMSDPLVVNELRTTKIDYNPAGAGDVAVGVSFNMSNNKVYGMADPVNPDHATTKSYVDNLVASIISPSLHLNPTFDQTASGKPTQWNDFFLTAPATLVSEGVAANVVSGFSAKLTPLTSGGSSNTGFFSEGSTHAVNDQQSIDFAIWCKTDIPAGSSPVLELSHLTAVAQADAAILNPNAITTSRTVVPNATWQRYQVSFGVPPGHLWGRFLIRLLWTGAITTRNVWLDESHSQATQAAPASQVPIGSITMYGSSAPPTGWLTCDGSSRLRTDYGVLFGVIGTAFGSVDATHFNLPDLRGRFPFGMSPGQTKGNIGDWEAGVGGTIPGVADAGRINHAHTHTNDLTGAANAATTGSANRVATVNGSLTGTSGPTSTGGVGAALTAAMANHGLMTLNFIIRAL